MRVVVVGAGLGGVAAAVGLVGAGHDVVLCERADQVREAGTGVVIMPNGVLALDALGVSRWARDQAEQPMSGGIRDHLGRRLLATGAAQAVRTQRALGAATVMVGRSALHRALRAPLTAGVLRTGMSVQRLHQDGDAVRVICDTTTLTADAAVVADGIRSTLRPQLFPLARRLTGAGSGDVVDRLRRYDAERRPRANRLLVQSSRMSRTMTLAGVRARLRNLGLRAVPDRLAAVALYRMMRIDITDAPP